MEKIKCPQTQKLTDYSKISQKNIGRKSKRNNNESHMGQYIRFKTLHHNMQNKNSEIENYNLEGKFHNHLNKNILSSLNPRCQRDLEKKFKTTNEVNHISCLPGQSIRSKYQSAKYQPKNFCALHDVCLKCEISNTPNKI